MGSFFKKLICSPKIAAGCPPGQVKNKTNLLGLSKPSLNCMLLNTRSINNKVYELTELLLERAVDICCVTETWVQEGSEPILADIKREGYDIISCPRRFNKRGGGIAFISKTNQFSIKQLKMINVETFEILEVILCGKTHTIRFSIIYRTGYLNKENKEKFFNELNLFMDSLLLNDNINIILGDFNFRVNTTDTLSMEFMGIMESRGFKQMVNGPTHIEGGCLDLVFSQLDFPIYDIKVLDTKALADHYPVEFSIKLNTVKLPSHFDIQRRDFSNLDPSIFKSNINKLKQQISILDIKNDTDIDIMLTKFNIQVKNVLDDQAPVFTKRFKVKKHIVVNKEIQEARRKKRRAERKYMKTRSVESKNQLKASRKFLSKVVQNARNKFFNDKFASIKFNTKQTYKIINQLLNKNQEKIFPSHFCEKILADKFAVFYRDKITNIRNELSLTCSQKFENNLNVIKMNQFKHVSVKDILDIITSLENKQSSLDLIPCKIVKLHQLELAPIFSKLVNSSFKLGYFPEHLKTAIVTPIIKSSRIDTEILSNYRPVSNLTILSKILEKCALKQLMEHLNTNNLYCKYQSAYRPGHSCETALMKIYNDVLDYLGPNSYGVLVLLDFSAAFDTIDHQILLKRLNYDYGIKGIALDWFSSYLKNRNYKVKINNTNSNSTQLNFGVPQGSILGPILFSLYIQNIKSIAHSYNINVHLYADDIQLYFRCNVDSNFDNLISCLEDIRMWCNNNFLKLNNNKTKIMAISSKGYKLSKIQELKLNGDVIKVEDSVKSLGFVIDKNFSMEKQINQVCALGYVMLRKLWKISKKINKELKIQLVHSAILSRINYCNSLYANLPIKHVKKLQTLMNSAVRFIYDIKGKNRFQHITPKLQELHFLPVNYRIKFKICLITYNTLNSGSPSYLKDLINIRTPNKNRFLRKDYDKSLLEYEPIVPQGYKNRSFKHVAPTFWNELPMNVRESPSALVFKSRLKTFYFSKWTQSNVI